MPSFCVCHRHNQQSPRCRLKVIMVRKTCAVLSMLIIHIMALLTEFANNNILNIQSEMCATISFTYLLNSVNSSIWKYCFNKSGRQSYFIRVTTYQLNWRNHLIGVLREGLWMAPLLAHHLDREADWRLYSGGRPRHYIGSACLVEAFFQANPELKPKLFL